VEDKNKNGWWLATALGIGVAAAYAALRRRRLEYEWENKVVLITGGSRGLGLVLARSFAAKGARIAIIARDAEELERAVTDLRKDGTAVFQTTCDVRNQSEVERAVEAVRSHYGQIDVLVNNAGVIQVGPLEVQTQTDFESAMAVHFWGAFYMMQAVLPEMKRRGAGRIVNISSIGGKIPVPHLAPYCASKFALVGLSGAMRVELAKDNIFVTTVCPGLMRTGSHVNAVFKGQNEKEFAWFSIGNALPVSSIGAERAAEQIIEATERGDAELIISVQAKLAAKAHALFPELAADISSLVNRMLPDAGGIGENHALGKDSASYLSPSFITASIDEQSRRNNELEPNEKAM
jgi:short-subunit dehydrogenase